MKKYKDLRKNNTKIYILHSKSAQDLLKSEGYLVSILLFCSYIYESNQCYTQRCILWLHLMTVTYELL